MSDSAKFTVLILRAGNSCRNQLSEGVASCRARRHSRCAKRRIKTRRLGSSVAIQVMKKIGPDVSDGPMKHMEEFLQQNAEAVITGCANVHQASPMLPGQLNRHHSGIDDSARHHADD